MRGGKWGEMGHMHTSTLHRISVQVRAGVPTIGRDTTRTPTCTGAARGAARDLQAAECRFQVGNNRSDKRYSFFFTVQTRLHTRCAKVVLRMVFFY